MPYATVYRVNPAWLCRIAPGDATGAMPLTAKDNALLVEVAGRLATHRPAGDMTDAEVRGALDEYRQGRGGDPVVIRLPVAEAAVILTARTHADLLKSVERVATSTNRGVSCFAAVRVDRGVVEFEVARNRALVDAHMVFAAPMWEGVPDDAPVDLRDPRARLFDDRHYGRVCPRVMSGWSSAASAPIAGRLVTWLMTPCRDGLDAARQHHVDESGCLVMQIAPDDLVDFLGVKLSPTRRAPSQVDAVLDRVRLDLLGVPVSLSVSRQRTRKVTFAVGLRAFVPEERAERWMQADPVTREVARSRPRGAAAFPNPPEPVPPCDDEVDAPATVVQPRPTRPGRIRVSPVADAIVRADAVATPPRAPLPVPVDLAPPEQPVDDIEAEVAAALASDPLFRVRGFLGRDGDGAAIWEADHRDLDIASTWYPHVVYPAVVPDQPWLAVTVDRPDVEGGPCVARTRACHHLPSPDVASCPHMHAHGVWASVPYGDIRGAVSEDDEVYVDVCLPTAPHTLVYCRTLGDYLRVTAPVHDWRRPPYEHERAEYAEAARVAGLPLMERLRREHCEAVGLDPDDPSVETVLD